MPSNDRMTFMVEDAKIKWPNFSGRPTRFDVNGGKRHFTIELDEKIAQQMHQDGWNVKFPKPGEPEDEDDEVPTYAPTIQIGVRFDKLPPKIVLITSRGRTIINEDKVDILDSIDVRTADLIANSYRWDVAGKSGIKAMLKSLFIIVEEDPLEQKYGGMFDGNDEG